MRPWRCKATTLPVLTPGSTTLLQRLGDVGEPQVPRRPHFALVQAQQTSRALTSVPRSALHCVAQGLPARALFSQIESACRVRRLYHAVGAGTSANKHLQGTVYGSEGGMN